MLLSEREKHFFSNYRTSYVDRSITSRLLDPLWSYVVQFIPSGVAPNLLSLASVVLLIQAWYICFVHGEAFPTSTTIFAWTMISAFYALDALDARHAIAIGNDSALTEFFDHVCSQFATIFLVLVMAEVFKLRDHQTVWYLVQTPQLILLNKHVGALIQEVISYRLFNGPGYAIAVSLGFL